MSLPTFTDVQPGITNQITNPTGSNLGQIIEEFDGIVEKTLESAFVLRQYFPLSQLAGTKQLVRNSVGGAKIRKVTPGTTPDGDLADFGKIVLTVDTHSYARNIIPVFDDFTIHYNVRAELAAEQGMEVTRFYDRALLIQATKAALLTASTYGSTGHRGASQHQIASVTSANLVAGLNQLFSKMEEKEVVPAKDGVIVVVKPAVMAALREADQLINGEYLTSAGNVLQGVTMLKYLGVPVLSSNQLPAGEVVTGTDKVAEVMGTDYEGDFSKVVAIAINPKKCLLAAQPIAPKSKIFYDDISKSWYVDTDFAFGARPNRAEFAGALVLP